jgi:hypothetical protein
MKRFKVAQNIKSIFYFLFYMHSYLGRDKGESFEHSPSEKLRAYCANCFYFRIEAISEMREKSGLNFKTLGRGGHYCGKKNSPLRNLLPCDLFDPWNKRAFKKYEELTDLINAQEQDNVYKSKLLEKKDEIAEYLKSINPALFLKLASKKP